MFSGIVEVVGTVERADRAGSDQGLRLSIRAPFAQAPQAGESIAVNGVCLTVELAQSGRITATAVPETLRKTTLGTLAPGARVNLERALRAGDPIGGHWVQGHVDAVAAVRGIERNGADTLLSIEVPPTLARYVATKGSLAVDGVSLTVAEWRDPLAVFALVPYTLEHTIASGYAPGDWVNLEPDLVARYLDRLLEERGVVRGSNDGSTVERTFVGRERA